MYEHVCTWYAMCVFENELMSVCANVYVVFIYGVNISECECRYQMWLSVRRHVNNECEQVCECVAVGICEQGCVCVFVCVHAHSSTWV